MPRHPAPAPDDRARRLPRAVLWDMDGTLVDTEPLWNAVQRRLVVEHGGTWSDDLAASLVGRPLDEGARRLQEAGLDLPVQRIIDLTMDEVMDADGSAFVVHTGEDDYTSQPSGDAGDRLACGVFEETQA